MVLVNSAHLYSKHPMPTVAFSSVLIDKPPVGSPSSWAPSAYQQPQMWKMTSWHPISFLPQNSTFILENNFTLKNNFIFAINKWIWNHIIITTEQTDRLDPGSGTSPLGTTSTWASHSSLAACSCWLGESAWNKPPADGFLKSQPTLQFTYNSHPLERVFFILSYFRTF